jgi:hypothetical protein
VHGLSEQRFATYVLETVDMIGYGELTSIEFEHVVVRFVSLEALDNQI